MRVINNCWKNIYVSSATFGDHYFNKDVAEIYVKEGVYLYPEEDTLQMTEEEIYEMEKKAVYLGACKLVFRNIHRVQFRITPFTEKSDIKCREYIDQDYIFGEKNALTRDFCFGVNIRVRETDFLLACVYWIYAENFSLHIFED